MNSKLDPNRPPQSFDAAQSTQPRKRERRGMLKYEQIDNYSSEESSGEEQDGDAPNADGHAGFCGQKRRPMSVS